MLPLHLQDRKILPCILDATESQLVLVDFQEKLMPAIQDSAAVLANARRLAQAAQLMDVPVWGTEQDPARLGSSDADLRALCRKTLPKMHFSAAPDGLAARRRRRGWGSSGARIAWRITATRCLWRLSWRWEMVRSHRARFNKQLEPSGSGPADW